MKGMVDSNHYFHVYDIHYRVLTWEEPGFHHRKHKLIRTVFAEGAGEPFLLEVRSKICRLLENDIEGYKDTDKQYHSVRLSTQRSEAGHLVLALTTPSHLPLLFQGVYRLWVYCSEILWVKKSVSSRQGSHRKP